MVATPETDAARPGQTGLAVEMGTRPAQRGLGRPPTARVVVDHQTGRRDTMGLRPPGRPHKTPVGLAPRRDGTGRGGRRDGPDTPLPDVETRAVGRPPVPGGVAGRVGVGRVTAALVAARPVARPPRVGLEMRPRQVAETGPVAGPDGRPTLRPLAPPVGGRVVPVGTS